MVLGWGVTSGELDASGDLEVVAAEAFVGESCEVGQCKGVTTEFETIS